MRLDPTLAMGGAALLGILATVEPVSSIVTALGLTAIFYRRLPLKQWVIIYAILAVSAWRADRQIETFETRRVIARDALGAPSPCAGQGVIQSSPISSGEVIRYTALFESLDCENGSLPSPLAVRLYGGPPDLVRGDVVDIVAKLGAIRTFRNFELPDPTPRSARRKAVLSGRVLAVTRVERGTGIRAWVDRARAHARQRINQTFAPRAAPMARALVLGENDLSQDDDEAFRQSGLAHLLAVSGTHLVFAVVALVRAFRFLLVRWQWLAARTDVARSASLIGAGLALLYADFAGGSGSAWRAAWMLTAAYLAYGLGRRLQPSRAIAFSLIIGVLVDPLIAFDISFLLSFAATAGLLLIGRPWAQRWLRMKNRLVRYLTASVIATVSSMIPCAPLLALLSPSITLAGVLANILAAPLGEIVSLPLCLSHIVLSPIPELEHGAAVVASGALLVVKRIAHLSADTTWLAVPVPPPTGWQFAALGLAVAGITSTTGGSYVAPSSFKDRWSCRLTWISGLFVSLSVLELAQKSAGQPLGELRVTTLDVGQGDSTLIDLPDGKLMLVDGGGFVGSPVDPGRSVLLPLLRARRRTHLDVIVISHPHPDHFTGLASAVQRLSVGELWDSGQGEREGAMPPYSEILNRLRARGVPVLRPAELCPRPRYYGSARVDILGPCPTFQPGINPNDNSLVLKISHKEHSVLLTGDAEEHQEAALVKRYGSELKADLLKVGHHGSRTSTTLPFVDAVRPSVATISCGLRNRFGHPHPQTLRHLTSRGVSVFRLDRTGATEWRSDGKRIRFRTFTEAR